MKRPVYTIDASGKVLGRIATDAAKHLIGKHRSTYKPNVDDGDTVVIKNAKLLRWTGRKLETKEYQWSTGRPGGLRSRRMSAVFEKSPKDVVVHAVYCMLPKNTHRTPRIKRLTVES